MWNIYAGLALASQQAAGVVSGAVFLENLSSLKQKKGTPKMDGTGRPVFLSLTGALARPVLGRVMNCFPKRGVPVKGLEHSGLDDSSQCCICSRHLVMRLGFFGL